MQILKIVLQASRRLRLRADAKKTLIYHVEDVLKEYNIHRHPENLKVINPREYRKKAEPQLLDNVQKSLEDLGFKFRRFPSHTPNIKAVESSGRYRSIEYAIDLIFRHDELEVDLYYF